MQIRERFRRVSLSKIVGGSRFWIVNTIGKGEAALVFRCFSKGRKYG